MAVAVSLKDLVETGAHFGHQTRRWNPKMDEFIYGAKEGVHIFDLTKTKEKLEESLEVLRNAAKEGKTILFVGTKKQAREKTAEVAGSSGSFYITERWLGGILTNFDQIKNSTRKLKEMKEKMAGGEYKSYTKKERLLLDREIKRLERFFLGIAEMDKLPEVMVIVDIRKEAGAVKEATIKGVETIGIVDSNSDPTDVDHPIPMNDDAGKAVEYVLELMGMAIIEGKKGKGKSATSTSSKKSKISRTSKTSGKSSKGTTVKENKTGSKSRKSRSGS
jgi:small subunit ribosomal protein S2